MSLVNNEQSNYCQNQRARLDHVTQTQTLGTQTQTIIYVCMYVCSLYKQLKFSFKNVKIIIQIIPYSIEK